MAHRGFGSDNHSGVHPDVLAAIAEANEGHAHGYGDDPWTARATGIIRDHLGECDVAFVFNGTGANCVGFAATCKPWESVICPSSAHIMQDEATAPERVGGVKLVPVDTPDGKLTPELVMPHLTGFGFEHHAQPRLISVSNVSEYGTVYTAEELRALSDLAHEHGMLLHVDGARIANAAAALGCSLAEITSAVGVDLLALGGTKNGMLGAEAVVLFGEARTSDLAYVRKMSTQLASKMRFLAAQFVAMYEDDLWLRCAHHANDMAAMLSDGAAALGVDITQPTQANEVFAILPSEHLAPLQELYDFYVWDEARSEVRWVASFDTTAEDVVAFLGALEERLG